MATPTNGRVVVEPPFAAAPRFGIQASIPASSTPGWEQGIAYTPEGCTNGDVFGICTTTERVDNDFPDAVQWNPFIIETNLRCSAFSGDSLDAQARVLRNLNLVTEYQLGLEFWEGNLAQSESDPDGNPWPNSYLADPVGDNLTPSGPVGLVHGLACLEQYLASNNGGQQGAIHATAQVATHWESFRLLRREGNKILTFQDTLIIVSPGYSGTDPNGGIADNNVWAYATDMPRYYLGKPEAPTALIETVDRTENTIVYQAQRRAMIEWERCRHAGVQLCVTLCGTGGS